MSNTTTSTLDNLLKNYFVPKALLSLKADTPLYADAEKAPQPKGSGTTTYWNAFNNVAAVSCALSEGTANTETQLSSRRVSATIAQYGRLIKLSDLAVVATHLDSLKGAMARLTQSAQESMERICQMGIFKNEIAKNQSSDVLSMYMSSPASSFCANTGTSNASDHQFQFPAVFGTSCTALSAVSPTAASISAKVSIYAIRKVLNRLRNQNAQPFADGFYHAYAHINFEHMLLSDPTYREWNQSQFARQTMHAGLVLPTLGIKFKFSTIAPRYAVTAHSVIPCFVYGMQAYGVTELDNSMALITTSGPDTADPFAQINTIAYKINAATAALNPSAGRILFSEEVL